MTTKNKVSRLTTDERIKKLVEIPDNDIDYSDIPDKYQCINFTVI